MSLHPEHVIIVEKPPLTMYLLQGSVDHSLTETADHYARDERYLTAPLKIQRGVEIFFLYGKNPVIGLEAVMKQGNNPFSLLAVKGLSAPHVGSLLQEAVEQLDFHSSPPTPEFLDAVMTLAIRENQRYSHCLQLAEQFNIDFQRMYAAQLYNSFLRACPVSRADRLEDIRYRFHLSRNAVKHLGR